MNPPEPYPPDPALVLVVDDDKFTRIQLRRAMQRAGYQVAEASDGEQALAAYTQRHPDIVLLDALMPVIDGFSCCTQLRALPSGEHTPILMITALEDQESVDRAFAVGATDYITKPIHWAVLRQRVRHLLQASRATAALRQQTEQAQLKEAQLRLALAAAQMGTWDWDLVNNNITWSEQLEILFGLESGKYERSYEGFINRVHPADRGLVEQAVQRAMTERAEYKLEFRIIRSDGNILWVVSRGQVYYDEQGKAVRLTGINMDISDRKRAEETLQQTTTLQRAILASANYSIISTTVDGTILTFNSTAERWLGYTAAEVVGKATPAIIHARDEVVQRAQQLSQELGRTIKPGFEVFIAKVWHGGVDEGEWSYIRQDGSRFPVLLSVTRLTDAQGNVTGFLGIGRDITERKRAEAALRQSEERFQRVAIATNDAIWDWELATNQVWWNRGVQTLFHYAATAVGADVNWWHEQIHPEERQRVIASIEAAINRGNGNHSWSEEYRFRRADGSYAYVFDRGYVVRDDTGKSVRMIGAMMDMTERQQAEAELQRQNKRSQLFADITLKIRQSLQIDQILQTTATEVQKLLQADRALIFRLWSNGYGQVITEAVVPGFGSVLNRGITDDCFSAEYLKKYQQGRIYTITNTEQSEVQPCLIEFLHQFQVKAKLVMPILLKEELWGLLIIHQCRSPRQWSSFEIDLLRQLADQIGIALAQAQLLEQETRQSQELARSNIELQQFASVASHDLQEPLRKIQAFGNRLKATCGEALTEQGQDYLERMQSAAQRMQALIDDLLTLSRIATRGQPFVPVSLNQVTQEVLSDLEVRIQQSRGKVEVGELPTIEADPIQIHQLLQNLITNALKFQPPDAVPVVKISSQLLDRESVPVDRLIAADFCQIMVADNGIGFDEKYLDRIFNVFQRLHNRSEYEGTGMGLTICQRIAERHGGSITAKSQLGQGATFIVTLPIKQVRGDNTE